MFIRSTSLGQFLRSEDGAVTVDWVVLTAALVGLGLATMSTVRGGVQNVSSDIDATLRSDIIQTRFAFLETLLNVDFSGGADGWSAGVAIDVAGFGEVLQLAGGDLAEIDLEVPDGATSATISFDMIAADDMDGDAATVLINGSPVSIYRDNHGSVTVESPDVPGVTVAIDQHYTNDPVGSGSHGHDSRATYTITVDDPGSSLRFGVASDANDGLNDEFYAIDDVRVTAN
ncbi:MAG: hypothetical protein AAF366_12330 [Pseudomonadota bacterium]